MIYEDAEKLIKTNKNKSKKITIDKHIDDIDDIDDNILDIPTKETDEIKNTTHPIFNVSGQEELIRMLSENLSVIRMDTFETWINYVLFCKNYGLRELAHKLLARSNSYNNGGRGHVDKLLNSKTSTKDPLTIKSLMSWSREDNVENHNEILKKICSVQAHITHTDEILLKDNITSVNYREDCRYISDDITIKLCSSGANVYILMSQPGGKTTTINKISGSNLGHKALSIISRRTMSPQQRKKILYTNFI